MGGRGVGFIALCLVTGTAFFAASAGAATFSSTTPILGPSGSGLATPYPSIIDVSGTAGTTTKVRVTLNDLNGGPERDLDVLLVGPGGSTILLSDVCSLGGVVPDFSHSVVTLDDDAPASYPETCAPGQGSGTYKPTNYDTADTFPGVAPPYPLGLGNLRGTSPNGSWRLYVYDDQAPDPINVNGGWTLELTTTGAPPTTTPKKKCKKHKKRSASAAKKRCKKKKR